MLSREPASSLALPPIRVLLADDHPIACEGLSALLHTTADIRVVATAHTARRALDLWHQTRPDLAILDLRLPDEDGARLTARLRREDPAARVVIITAHVHDEALRRCIEAGAACFLSKCVAAECLLTSVRRVHHGDFVLEPALADRLAAHLERPALTARECEILALLRAGHTNKELADRLYISVHTVKTHLKNLFEKLSVLSRAEAVRIALERGLVET
jgi:DNA-binding NarL/FixJ family response regulator